MIYTFDNLPEAISNLSKEVSEIKDLLSTHQPNQQTEPDKPLDVHEAAEFLHLAVSTIYSKNSRGELPSMKEGKKLLFLKSDLLEYLKKHKKKTHEQLLDEATDVLKTKKG